MLVSCSSLDGHLLTTLTNITINYSIPWTVDQYSLLSLQRWVSRYNTTAGDHELTFVLTSDYPSKTYTFVHPFFVPETPQSRPSHLPGSTMGSIILGCHLPLLIEVCSYAFPIILLLCIVYPYCLLRFYYHINSSELTKNCKTTWEKRSLLYHTFSTNSHFSTVAKHMFVFVSDPFLFLCSVFMLLWELFAFYRIGSVDSTWFVQNLWGMVFFQPIDGDRLLRSLDLHCFHVLFITFGYIPLILYFILFSSPSISHEKSSCERFWLLLVQLLCIASSAIAIPLFKLIIIGINISIRDMLLSPVWLYSSFVPFLLIIREMYVEKRLREYEMEKSNVKVNNLSDPLV